MLKLILIMLLISILIFNVNADVPQPEGPNITDNVTETATPDTAAVITTAGGTITTMTLNGTTQTPRWKAYVGNVSGTLALEDASGNLIYDWTLATPTGEVYATRKSTTVNWTAITCANYTHTRNEEVSLNLSSAYADSIFNTFASTTHREFYTSVTQFAEDECNYTTATYVNSTAQSTYFQEILLYDGTTKSNGYIVYATLVENVTAGFDFDLYHFQMIVAENGSQTEQQSISYYFYLELV